MAIFWKLYSFIHKLFIYIIWCIRHRMCLKRHSICVGCCQNYRFFFIFYSKIVIKPVSLILYVYLLYRYGTVDSWGVDPGDLCLLVYAMHALLFNYSPLIVIYLPPPSTSRKGLHIRMGRFWFPIFFILAQKGNPGPREPF